MRDFLTNLTVFKWLQMHHPISPRHSVRQRFVAMIMLPVEKQRPAFLTQLAHNLTVKKQQTKMFIAALFTIARTWKQPKCPSSDEWIKKMWHIYTMEYYSAL